MRRFYTTATVFFVLLNGLFVVGVSFLDDLDGLSWPGYSAVRLYDQELDATSGMGVYAPGAGAIAEALGAGHATTRNRAVAAYEEVLAYWDGQNDDAVHETDDEVVDQSDDEVVDEEPDWLHEDEESVEALAEERDHLIAHLVVLLLEEGRDEDALRYLEQLRTEQPEPSRFTDMLRTAYPKLGSPGAVEPSSDVPLLGWGWTARTVSVRLKDQGVDPTTFGLPAEPLADLPDVVASSARVLSTEITVLVLTLAAAVYVWRKRLFRQIADGMVVTMWPLSNVIGVLARALPYGILATIPVYMWSESTTADQVAWFVSSIPFLYLMHRYLVRPGTWAYTFGLRVRSNTGLSWVWIGVAAGGICLTADIGLQLFGRSNVQVPWSDFLIGDSLHLSSFDFAVMALYVTVGAPLVEEIAFRGTVYPTLRRWLGPGVAAVASALLFGSLHLYSPAGFLIVTWVGLVLAVTYERTRSLLPCILAHAVNNALVVLELARFL